MHANESSHDQRTYIIVMNDEEQYSLWLAGKHVPPGWAQVGQEGSQQECLEHICSLWRDMRPRSLRLQENS